jgi:hypothetical protein
MPLNKNAGIKVDDGTNTGGTPYANPTQYPWMHFQGVAGPDAVFNHPTMKTRKQFAALKVFF